MVFKIPVESAIEQKNEFGFLDCGQNSGWLFSKIKQSLVLSLWFCSLKCDNKNS